MSSAFVFMKPRDWETLEDIVCDVFARKYSNYNFQRYGRRGQKQCGVDIAGPIQGGLLGIQCKHHSDGNIPLHEIDEALAASEHFIPALSQFIIATSADRDTSAHKHVLEMSEDRALRGKYPLTIKFWDDICGWLSEYPDLVYKYFASFFSDHELETPSFPGVGARNKNTVCWPTTLDRLNDSISRTMSYVDRVQPYNLTLGISTFPGVGFDRMVDLDISLEKQFTASSNPQSAFLEAANVLGSVRAIVSDPVFSKELVIHLQARLSAAFLVGWMFRRAAHFNLKLVFLDQVWATNGLPDVPPQVADDLPILLEPDSGDVVLVFNISREITSSVLGFVSGWARQPRVALAYSLADHSVTSAAHALSVANYFSAKIKTIVDRWQAQKIHVFTAMPAALATLVGFNLNAICPILIYFRDDARTTYQLGGTVTNGL